MISAKNVEKEVGVKRCEKVLPTWFGNKASNLTFQSCDNSCITKRLASWNLTPEREGPVMQFVREFTESSEPSQLADILSIYSDSSLVI